MHRRSSAPMSQSVGLNDSEISSNAIIAEIKGAYSTYGCKISSRSCVFYIAFVNIRFSRRETSNRVQEKEQFILRRIGVGQNREIENIDS